MTDLPCPMGVDHEPLRHPDAMFCTRCVVRLPQRHRRAITRAGRGDDDPAEVLQRCRAWLVRRAAGVVQEPPRPKPVVRYTSTSR